MKIKVLYFASLKVAIGGVSSEWLELPEGATVGDVVREATRLHPEVQGFSGSLLTAHNQQWAPMETPLADGDEVALMPPVSGG